MIPPFRLTPLFSPRPWGSWSLAPWYTEKLAEPVGEAWLTGAECVIETGKLAGQTLAEAVREQAPQILGESAAAQEGFPLLLKLLFPKEKLSVQVHPDDTMAAAVAGEPRGKTECWYVLEADPGAVIALGLHRSAQSAGDGAPSVKATRDKDSAPVVGGKESDGASPYPPARSDVHGKILDAVRDETLEQMLNWIPVSPGEMYYVDAGTIHAIGPGVVLLETQQYSDLTYRLYDYGRPRELHLDLALDALRHRTEAGKVEPIPREGYDELIRRRHFIVERYRQRGGEVRRLENTTGTVQILTSLKGSAIVMTTAGSSTMPDDSGGVELSPGRAVIVPAGWRSYSVTAREPLVLIRAMPPPFSAEPEERI